jgi:hypothetical protein
MNTTLLQLGLLSLAIGASASAQTYTNVMSGESSTSFSFLSGTGSRTTVTSIQSPFGYPNTITGANDSQTYPSGSTGGNPEPWWFYYDTCGSNTCAHDLTGAAIPRPPAIGQVSYLKSSAIGFLTKATLNGTVSNGGSHAEANMYETFFLTERNDHQGQKEIGIARQMSPYAHAIDPTHNSGDYLYAYWFTNDNCGAGTSVGYPTISLAASCGTSQANGSVKALGSGLQVGYNIGFICGPSTTTCAFTGGTYIFQTYIFWASWDSTYKQRIEIYDSSLSTLLFGDNIDTTYLGVSLGLTTSGASGYVTLGTQRFDPSNTLCQTGVNLSVNYVQIITP